MSRSAFGRLHPAVSLTVGASIVCLAFLTRDPLCALLLAAGVLAFNGELFGASFALKRLLLFLTLALAGGVTNPLISHRGVTILFYLGDGAITAESALYGAVSGALLADVILWCEALYRALPSGAALWLTGRLLPRTTLVFTMAIRFVPRLATRLREARAAQRPFHTQERLRHAVVALQTGVALTLEESCEIAAGMEERGYGKGKITSYSLYRFRGRDGWMTGAVLILDALALTGFLTGALHFSYYPGLLPGTGSPAWYVFPLALAFLPAIAERKEKMLWRFSRSKT
ncbi:MAG: hypothetical protein J6Z79_06680 [Clostridia bacterium]|nr:hypothetical protein [Clostridia bacterium]